jgi:hypothetical protein
MASCRSHTLAGGCVLLTATAFIVGSAHAGAAFSFTTDMYGMTAGGATVAMGAGDYGVIDLFVQCHTGDPATRLLSLIDMDITLASGSFVHNDADATGHGNAFYSKAGLGGTAAIDSFVSMGDFSSGDPFVATLDPNFNGSVAGSVSADAGWYNDDPTNGQGVVGASFTVFIGRFVIAQSDVIGNSLTVNGTTSYNFGSPGVFFDSDTEVFAMPSTPVVPGPVAVTSLLGLAAARRRRIR